MKRVLTLFILFSFLWTQKGINLIEEVIVAPEFMAFRTKIKRYDAWTVQTIGRNFDIYGLTINAQPSSVDEVNGVPVRYYKIDSIEVQYSKWSTEITKNIILLSDVSKISVETQTSVRDKLSMVAYLNRKNFPFIEDFFSKTFTVGESIYNTTLDKPINLIDYSKNQYLYFQDRLTIHVILPDHRYKFLKSNYDWEYREKKIFFYPTKSYIEQKSILAIKSERSWYNLKWERLRQKRKLYGVVTQAGFNWNKKGLDDREKDLIDWFKKK